MSDTGGCWNLGEVVGGRRTRGTGCACFIESLLLMPFELFSVLLMTSVRKGNVHYYD